MIPVAGAQMGSEGDDDELRVGKGEGGVDKSGGAWCIRVEHA